MCLPWVIYGWKSPPFFETVIFLLTVVCIFKWKRCAPFFAHLFDVEKYLNKYLFIANNKYKSDIILRYLEKSINKICHLNINL